MNFPILDVRSHTHRPDELFPVIAMPEAERPLFLHADDGNVVEHVAREVAVRAQRDGHVNELMTLRRREVLVTITDARVAVTCDRSRHHDSVVAGHVKYPWLVAVGGSEGHGRSENDQLRLIVQRVAGDYAVLDLGFAEGVDVHALAADVARRAAALWLETHPGVRGETAETWVQVSRAQREAAPRGEFHLHWMPDYVPVPARSARSRPVPSQRRRTLGG